MKVVSLFAGIGGFDLGFEQSGFKTVAHVEKDVSCRKLLADKFPNADAFYDVTSARGINLPACDVLCAGFPCQDVSVAGQRAGLDGDRTGLFYQFTRIAYELKPSFLVWENVPGLLSSNKGHDFLAVLAEFRRIGYHGGWRTLDAQYFGVAQRRRRIFGVFARRDIGAACCAEILSLHEGLRGHPAPSRKTGASIASAITRGLGSGGADDNKAQGNHLVGIPEIADCLQERDSKGADSNTKNGHLIVARSSGRGYWTEDQKAATLGTEARAVHESKLVVHTPLCEFIDWLTTPPIAFPQRMSGTQCASAEDISPSLQSVNPTAVAVGAFKPNQGAKSRTIGYSENISPTLEAAKGGNNKPAVLIESHVRRLTPLECERLQGFPDNWTAGFSDSTRYQMLGNAVAVPVARWIAQRLAKHL